MSVLSCTFQLLEIFCKTIKVIQSYQNSKLSDSYEITTELITYKLLDYFKIITRFTVVLSAVFILNR